MFRKRQTTVALFPLHRQGQAGAPEPSIEYTPGDLWVKFPFSPAYLTGTPTILDAGTISGKSSGKTPGKSSGKSSGKIIEIVRSAPSISIQKIATLLGISERAVEKQIRQLKATDQLRRIGPAKGGHWEVRASTDDILLEREDILHES